jgi:hypothetical protein
MLFGTPFKARSQAVALIALQQTRPSMRDGKRNCREACVGLVNFAQTAAGWPVMLPRSNREVAK